jgi:dCTP diphosphatase
MPGTVWLEAARQKPDGSNACATDCLPPGSTPMKPMTDAKTTVAELRERVLGFVHERDWEQFHSPKNLSMALAAEAGELMEHFLWAESKASLDAARDPKKRPAIEAEIADVVIYALEFANMCGIDLAAAIEIKMAANAKKYPVDKARGRADKYTEL